MKWILIKHLYYHDVWTCHVYKNELFHIYNCIVSKIGFEDWAKYAAQVTTSGKIFNGQQKSFISVKYEQSKSIVQRAFRREFYSKAPRKVPNIFAFTRILKLCKEKNWSSTWSLCRQIKRAIAEQQTVKFYFEQNPKSPVRQAERALGFSYFEIFWRIMRKNLKWKAY